MPSLIPGEPLRVLLVSTNAELHDEVGAALAAGAGEHRYFWVSQPDLALVRGQDLAPHVILLDGGLVDVPGLVRQLNAGVSQAALLVLVPAGAQGLLVAQDAMLAGAAAFSPTPVQADDLVATLRQVLARGRAASTQTAEASAGGRVIVFCGPKGGTGRTTLAINTAVSLVQIVADRVALVDADYAAPAIDVALNLRSQRDIRDLLPKLSQLDAELLSGVLATHSSGVKVLLAPPPDAERVPLTLPQVQQVIAWLRRIFPWVLVDLGLPLDEAAFVLLDLADRVVISIPPELVGARNAKLMLAQFTARGYPADKVWPVLNREGLGGSLSRSQVEEYLGWSLRLCVPNDQELATKTINSGVPMVIGHQRRPVAQAYGAFARELVADRQATQPRTGLAPDESPRSAPRPSRSPRLWQRLAGGRILRPVLVAAISVLLVVLLLSRVVPWLARRPAGEPGLTAGAPPAGATAVLMTPPMTGAAPALSAATAAPSPGPVITSSPAPSPAIVARATAAPMAVATVAPTGAARPTATATAPPTATATAVATPTATETTAPTATATTTPSATPTLAPTPAATRPPARTPAPRATVAQALVLSAPGLVSPAPSATLSGVVAFRWQPTGPLPAGAAYEVVWWNEGEDPAAARGFAPPTNELSLAADLDVLYTSGQLKTSTLRWTVLIVRTQPYARLTQPGAGPSSPLVYQGGQPGGELPPPPKP